MAVALSVRIMSTGSSQTCTERSSRRSVLLSSSFESTFLEPMARPVTAVLGTLDGSGTTQSNHLRASVWDWITGRTSVPSALATQMHVVVRSSTPV